MMLHDVFRVLFPGFHVCLSVLMGRRASRRWLWMNLNERKARLGPRAKLRMSHGHIKIHQQMQVVESDGS